MLTLDIETSFALKNWIELAGSSDGCLLRGLLGRRLNQAMDPRQISRMFNSLAIKADIEPKQISGHLTQIGAAQHMLDSGASIGQIVA